jgi:Tol biopolymer transport system component
VGPAALAGMFAVASALATGVWMSNSGGGPILQSLRSASNARLVLRPLANRRPQGVEIIGKPSPDGRLIPLYDEQARLVIADIDLENLGAPIVVSQAVDGLDACDLGITAISPDNREAAFVCNRQSDEQELRTVHLDAAQPAMRRLLDGPWTPLHWPHPEYLLVQRQSPPRQLAIVDVSTGALRPVIALPTNVDAASLSSDGEWVVYDTQGAQPGDHDVFAVSAQGGAPVPVALGAHDDLFPTWSPSNTAVVFVSDRTGSPGLWMQPITDGRPVDAAQSLTQDLGRVSDVWGLTPTGEWIYFRQTGLVRTMTASLDRAGRLVGDPSPIPTRQVGGTMMASWSPDSRRLAYQVTLTGSRSLALGVLDVENGRERVVRVPFRWFQNPRWTDNRHVAVRGTDFQDRGGVHIVDVESGTSSLLVADGTPGDQLKAFQAGHRNDVVVWLKSGFYRIDVATRNRTLVHRHDDALDAFAVSPIDGGLAFIRSGDAPASLVVVGPNGKETRLATAGDHERFGEFKWSADGSALTFTRQRLSDKPEERVPSLWRVELASAVPEPLGLSVDGLRDLSVSPDGRAISFTAGWPRREAWVLENFLPPPFRSSP